MRHKKAKEEIKNEIITRFKTKIRDISFIQFENIDIPLNRIIFYNEEDKLFLAQYDRSREIKEKTITHTYQDPITYQEAMLRPDCHLKKKAVKNELDSMYKKNVRNYVSRPNKEVVIDSRWLFKKKVLDDKEIGKGRLVIRGFKDRNIIMNYATLTHQFQLSRQFTVKILLAIINKYNLEVAPMSLDIIMFAN